MWSRKTFIKHHTHTLTGFPSQRKQSQFKIKVAYSKEAFEILMKYLASLPEKKQIEISGLAGYATPSKKSFGRLSKITSPGSQEKRWDKIINYIGDDVIKTLFPSESLKKITPKPFHLQSFSGTSSSPNTIISASSFQETQFPLASFSALEIGVYNPLFSEIKIDF